MSISASSIPREKLESIRRRLLDRQRALLDDVDGLEADLRAIEEGREAEPEARSQGEAMARLLDRVRERDRHELQEIYRALAKIPSGVYGVCESCRAPIPPERLEAAPETRHCLECERRPETAVPGRHFEPRAHRAPPGEYLDLDDEELAEAVRERLRAHGDPDLLGVDLRCHGGVVRLSGTVPSEGQRQILVQIVADGMGLEVLDRLRVAPLDREGGPDVSEPLPEPEGPPVEERIPAGRGMQPLAREPWSPPPDEGEPPETPSESPTPETE
jgi:DnaK suppressor protein